MRTVFGGLLANPIGLDSIYSWLLFALGIGVSISAIWKGHGFDDPYPGYGAHERRRIDAVGSYDRHRRDQIFDAASINEEYSELALDRTEDLRAASAERNGVKAARARCLSEFAASEANLAEAARLMLATYREANLATRRTPPPTYFSDIFTFEVGGLDLDHVRDLCFDDSWEFDAQALIAELDELRQKVTSEHTKTLDAAPPELVQ